MKKIAFALLFVATSAQADLCPHYEFAELQSMTVEELTQLRASWASARLEAWHRNQRISPADQAGCDTQDARIERVIQVKLQEPTK